jgi:hypothetical protein
LGEAPSVKPGLFESVISRTSELKKPQVPEHLKLLANLWADVLVSGMQIPEVGLKTIELL